jgi:hypothetical protein
MNVQIARKYEVPIILNLLLKTDYLQHSSLQYSRNCQHNQLFYFDISGNMHVPKHRDTI